SSPTLEETLTPGGNINPDIEPEKGWNFEIGLRGDHFRQKLSFEFVLYTMRIRDLLVARRLALDQYIGINAGKTVHNGFEAYLRYDLLSYLSIYLNYTNTNYRFDEFVEDQRDFSGNQLTGSPPHTVNGGLDLQLDNGLYGHLTYRFVDALPITDDNTVFSDAYQLMRLKVGYNRAVGKWRVDAHLGIDNLWDEKYSSMFQINAAGFGGSAPRYYYPGLPRNYFGGIKLTYELAP
ncbi:MAG: TonB-dependent receptor, partial [Saprospiraceae bacterium]|nr:TonB-dependent receptor [Saprospiraceae bacterium]